MASAQEIKAAVDEHDDKLEEHSQVLAEHDVTLRQHGELLKTLTSDQKNLTSLVMGNQTTLAALTVTVANVKDELGKLNGGLMRLILILVIGLLILAGVTKADELAKIATGGM